MDAAYHAIPHLSCHLVHDAVNRDERNASVGSVFLDPLVEIALLLRDRCDADDVEAGPSKSVVVLMSGHFVVGFVLSFAF